jgi:tetratricopeptide (TPR) repeat protein
MWSEETRRAETAFERLRDQGHQALDAGRLEEGAEILQRALELAREQGDARLVDTALCNRAAAVIELGRGAGEVPRLREILVRNGDPANCRMAAYNIARFYELTKNYKKALFYARIARDRSEQLGRQDWLASSHNLIGNTLLAESFVDEAAAEYEKALALTSPASHIRAPIIENLGYCRILQHRYREGYELLYRGLALLRHAGSPRREALNRLALSFAHLETGRYRHCWRHALAALELAESIGDCTSIKNALYLLGESAQLSGDAETARRYFTRLHREFFPDASYLPDFLLAVDIRRLVNLFA